MWVVRIDNWSVHLSVISAQLLALLFILWRGKIWWTRIAKWQPFSVRPLRQKAMEYIFNAILRLFHTQIRSICTFGATNTVLMIEHLVVGGRLLNNFHYGVVNLFSWVIFRTCDISCVCIVYAWICSKMFARRQQLVILRLCADLPERGRNYCRILDNVAVGAASHTCRR